MCKRAWVDDSPNLILTDGVGEWWSECKIVFTVDLRDELELRLVVSSSAEECIFVETI